MRNLNGRVLLIAIVVLTFACSKQTASSTKAAYTGLPESDVTEAIKAGDTATVKKLISSNAALLQLRDAQGRTLLHTAVLYDKPDIVNMLIDKGIDPNVQDNSEMTPLEALDQSGFRAVEARKTLRKRGGKT